MSINYDIYLKNHIASVSRAYHWILNNISPGIMQSILPNLATHELTDIIYNHDKSKYSSEEYEAYDDYFYKNKKNTADGDRNFKFAWLHHIHSNPHHWQHWVLIEDDNGKPTALDMPDNYILEMICDWWSFSWIEYDKSKNILSLYGIFDWYEDHRNIIIFSDDTRDKVNTLLDEIKKIFDEWNINF